MPLIRCEVIETYYGLGVHRNDGRLELIVWLDPMLRAKAPRQPAWKLIIDMKDELETYGAMLVETRRIKLISEDAYLNGLGNRPGRPQWVSRLTYDPNPDRMGQPSWRGEKHGEWPVRRVRINRRSLWERLR